MPDIPMERRLFLASLVASGALTACGGPSVSAPPVVGPTEGATSTPAPGASSNASPNATASSAATATPSSGSAKTPLTIDATQTDLSVGTPVYAYVVGGVLSGGVESFYRLDASGVPHIIGAGDNTQAAGTFPNSSSVTSADAATLAANYPNAWADYSIPISLTSKTVIDLSKINTTTIPTLGTGTAAFSGRIYISVGVPKLPFTALSATAYTAPVFTAPPGNLTLFDWVEFSYDGAGNFNGNTTQVDQFGFALSLNGTPGGALQGSLNQSRPTIADTIAGLGGAYAGLQVAVTAPSAYPSGVNVLRMISPKQRIVSSGYGGSLLTFFDATIAQWYATWATTPLIVKTSSSTTYTGLVLPSGDLSFYTGSFPTLAQAGAQLLTPAFTVAPSTKISSSDVWQCAGSLASGGSDQKDVEKALAAAFNRGVISNALDLTACSSGAATFYPSGGVPFNAWARQFHACSANGLAYGFPYDDVCGQNPTISLAATQSVTITLGKFFS